MVPVTKMTLFIDSICPIVMYCSSLKTFLVISINVCTIANPENTAPATKYGGKIVVCHPGITEVAKSKLTIVCTESTRGVANPASTRDKASHLCQCLAEPVHPKLKKLYTLFLIPVALSLMVAKSGTRPVYQNKTDTVRYVLMANTSQSNGELKFGHKDPLVLGYGNMNMANQIRPMCINGKSPAHITANMVIASGTFGTHDSKF